MPEKITIARSGKSTFAIVLRGNSPTSLQDAAKELQQCVEIATGARLPICFDVEYDPVKTPHFISLGDTNLLRSQSEKYTFSTSLSSPQAMSAIRAYNGNIFIIGTHDTQEGEISIDGEKCTDSANGVYIFLDDYLGVRWLMPGDANRIVPKKEEFTISGFLDEIAEFPFQIRQVKYLQNTEIYR